MHAAKLVRLDLNLQQLNATLHIHKLRFLYRDTTYSVWELDAPYSSPSADHLVKIPFQPPAIIELFESINSAILALPRRRIQHAPIMFMYRLN